MYGSTRAPQDMAGWDLPEANAPTRRSPLVSFTYVISVTVVRRQMVIGGESEQHLINFEIAH